MTGYPPIEEFLYLCGKCLIIHFDITGTEIVVSSPDVIVTVTVIVTGATKIIVISGTGIVCNVYVMTTSKRRSIIIVAIGCTGRTGHVVLEIAISITISQ